MDRKTGTGTGRLLDVVLIRCISIVLVVLFHSYAYYFEWAPICDMINSGYREAYWSFFRILDFRMPTFLMISGLLFGYLLGRDKYSSPKDFFINKTKRLLIPYFVFSIASMATFMDFENWDLIFEGYIHYWFLLMLFFSFAITYAVDRLCPRWMVWVVFALSIVASAYTIGLTWLRNMMHMYTFFLLGYMIMRLEYMRSLVLKSSTIVIALVVALLGCYLRMLTDNPIVNQFRLVAIEFVIYGGINFLIERNIIRISENGIVGRINAHSYGIYVFHMWIIWFLYHSPFEGMNGWFIALAKAHDILYPILLFLVVLPVSLLISICFKKTRVGRFLIR